MTTPQGDGGGLAVGAELKLSIDSLRAEVRAARKERNDLNQLIYPVPLPAIQGAVSSGSVTITSRELWGPREGNLWFLERVTIDGLVAGSQGASVNGYGSVTNPSAGGTIASVSLTAGTWLVTVAATLSGTTASGDQNNIELTLGSTTLLTGMMLDQAFNQPFTEPPVVVTPATTQTLAVKAVAAAAAATSVYSAVITAIPAVTADDKVTLYRGEAQPQNKIHDFTASDSEWWPGEDFFLKPGDHMTVKGSSLNATAVTVSADAVNVAQPWAGAYLL